MSTTVKERLEQYPEISFIEGISFEAFLSDLLKTYQERYRELTGKEAELPEADPIRLILYSCSVLLYQGMQYIDKAGKMGLLKYSSGEFLDNLAALKKVERNPAKQAETVLRFTLSAAQQQVIGIPKGTRVKGRDLFFATEEYGEITAGEMSVEIPAACLTPGEGGNGFLPGELHTLVDPVNYIGTVANTTTTAGGEDRENDESLAERIYLSPSSYSTAGPEDAYRYWVMTKSSEILDCKIYSENPGEVDIYVMMQDGKLPDEGFRKELEQYLSDDNRRPLTDLVKVKAPEEIKYQIDATYYIKSSDRDMAEEIKKKAESACQSYTAWQQSAIARDINPSRLMYELMQAGVKWVEIRSPAFTEITGAKVAKAERINLVYGGLQDD